MQKSVKKETCNKCGRPKKEVFCRYRRRKDGTIEYPKNADFFHFFVCDCKNK